MPQTQGLSLLTRAAAASPQDSGLARQKCYLLFHLHLGWVLQPGVQGVFFGANCQAGSSTCCVLEGVRLHGTQGWSLAPLLAWHSTATQQRLLRIGLWG